MSDETETDDLATVPRKARQIQVKNFIDEAQLRKDMGYSLADLSTAMMEQSSLLVHYGVLLSKSSRQVDDVKMLLENAEAAAYRRIRDDKATAGEKVTEAQLEKLVSRHPQVIAFKKALNEAKQIEAVAKIAVEGFRHRRDMLIQHGLISREELKGEVSLNRRREAEEDRRALENRVLNRNRTKTDDAA